MIWILLLLFFVSSAEASPAEIEGSRNETFTYQTTKGPASAILSVPPRANGDLVLYLHPTTGIDDRCAPSGAPDNSYFQDDGMRQELQSLADAGYTILQPDYLGLGTPGPHPFLQTNKNIPAISRALQEALQKEPGLSGRYLALGYSQGASLALETAHRSARLPGLLQGTVSLAPPAFLEAQIKAASLLDTPSTASAVLIYLARSSGNRGLLTPKAQRISRQGRGMCILEFSALMLQEGLAPGDVLRSDWWQNRDFVRYLQGTEVSKLLPGRSLLLSADNDAVIFPSLVQLLSQKILLEGSQVEAREFRADHFSLPRVSWPIARNFIERSFQGPSARFYLPIGAQ